ncbi:unnamed protein product [Clonostachys solani]|uniref:Beta-fructofuranosidase n=1 Tax=Clonostachys solani TaxID=160281 RepID=A0A9P0EQ69_9HYPO|nr:unnamed protein product [Clonostachys solani]
MGLLLGTLKEKQDPKWHPLPNYHLKALKGWLNDPCAPGYDVKRGTYHLFYQWNPKSCEWGDICWGQFMSNDGLTWEHNGSGPALERSLPYDHLGIFTGCMHPTGPHGEPGQLTVFYSSVKHLPIHWTLPYERNCAGLAMATSVDGGHTWLKSPLNPILEGEPEGLVVTGFRDPYLSQWPEMASTLGEDGNKLYGVVSGGIVGKGPNAFLYSVSPNDLATWAYIGTLTDIPIGFTRPTHWTGDFGLNWECVNFMSIGDEKDRVQVLTFCSEGGFGKDYVKGQDGENGAWTLWMAGSLQKGDSGVTLKHEFSGFLDHGNLYAPNSYKHPISGERIVWGWIKEDELPLPRRESKGWAGYLSIPREVFLLRRSQVIRTIKTPLREMPSLNVYREPNGTNTVQTLGIRPLPSIKALRKSKPIFWTLPLGTKNGDSNFLRAVKTTSWEIEAVVSVGAGLKKVGFHIKHNNDHSHGTTVIFSAEDEKITVDRSRSNDQDDIPKKAVDGPFTLFVLSEHELEVIEELHMRLFCDGDVLEVFANDRFALSTVVYSDTQSCCGISSFVEKAGCDDATYFRSISLWEELGGP